MPFIFEKAYHGETPLESEIRGKKKKNLFLKTWTTLTQTQSQQYYRILFKERSKLFMG